MWQARRMMLGLAVWACLPLLGLFEPANAAAPRRADPPTRVDETHVDGTRIDDRTPNEADRAPQARDAAEPPPAQTGASTGYQAAQAELDVESLLTGTPSAYLAARARLSAHPPLAATALTRRLAAVPPLGPAERKRLLDVLATLPGQRHVETIVTELRRDILDAKDERQANAAVERWLPVLRDQGSAAIAPLLALVDDARLPIDVRTSFIAEAVQRMQASDIASIIARVDTAAPPLQFQLRRSLRARIAKAPELRAPWVSAIDQRMQNIPPTDERLAWLLANRTAVAPVDPAFERILVTLADDRATTFATRIAAMRRLPASPRRDDLMTRIAQTELNHRPLAQTHELLGFTALTLLPPASIQLLSTRLNLLSAEAPRLQALAYASVELSPRHEWLPHSQRSPWPEVRRAALDRVQAPCSPRTARELAGHATGLVWGGAEDGSVARAAVRALGRCGDSRSMRHLVRLLRDHENEVDRRAEAARELLRQAHPTGTRVVLEVLADAPGVDLEHRLTRALGYTPQPTPSIRAALCERLQGPAQVVKAANDSLAALFDAGKDTCTAN